ncbi:DMT family transporter [Synechococcus sp. Nb3U1]|uniref:DMT family transporter n=1 Tax=Synechococcus sp. Nb3U1 TaxID=1914529 RepID=UPI001F372BD4|nr:DMT family transporter [Synechococcus sp. Nb3U1]MCF2969985.1 DMT family transporter [Synechococcus sp. Nb3U1]
MAFLPRDPLRAYFYLAAAILGWATAASAFKLGLQHFSPPVLLIFSALSSCLVLGVVLLLTGRTGLISRQSRAQIQLSAVQGLLNPFGYYLVLFQAYDRLSAQAALALNYTWPVALALLAVPLLRERFRWRMLLALGVSLLGVVLVATGGSWQTLQGGDPVGVLLAVGSAGIWALYWLLNVRDSRDGVLKLWMGFVFGSCYCLLLLPFQTVQWNGAGLGWAAYIGLAEMGLTFVFWLRALELTGHRGSLANGVYVTPFLSLGLIAVILREPIALGSVVGLGLIIASNLYGLGSRAEKPAADAVLS